MNLQKGQTITVAIISVNPVPRQYQDKWLFEVSVSLPGVNNTPFNVEEVCTEKKSRLAEHLFQPVQIVCLVPGTQGYSGPNSRYAWVKLDEPMPMDKTHTAGGMDRDLLWVARDSMKIAAELITSGKVDKQFELNNEAAVLGTLGDLATRIANHTLRLARELK